CLLLSLCRLPTQSTPFPYTTLFRSRRRQDHDAASFVGPAARPPRRHSLRRRGHHSHARPPHRRDGHRPLAGGPQRVSHVDGGGRSEEHTSELQSREKLVCRLLLEKK